MRHQWFGPEADVRLDETLFRNRRPYLSSGGVAGDRYVAALEAIHRGRFEFEPGDFRNWLVECRGWSTQDAQDCSVASAAVIATLAYRDGKTQARRVQG